MTSSSSPTNPWAIVVADASVLINLNATGCARTIVQSVASSFLVTEQAFAELVRGERSGHDDARRAQELVDNGTMRIVSLGEVGSGIYGHLVSGAARATLDDGEAATIAHAFEVGGVALIDDQKAERLCERSYPSLCLASTVDLLLCEAAVAPLGYAAQADAVVKALRGARMRVPSHQLERVIALIGPEAAANCNSLPRRRTAGARSARA